MSIPVAFILGLLIGWVIEWVIDWLYWRRRMVDAARSAAVLLPQKSGRLQHDLENQLAELKAENAALREKVAGLTALAQTARIPNPLTPDDLTLIKGIGPVIAAKLNAAGIHTFQDLGAMTPARLRDVVGDAIQRLADEEDILQQARQMAEK